MTNEQKPRLLTRREAILKTSAMLGGTALIGQAAMLAGCESDQVDNADEASGNGLFSNDDIALLTEISEIIFPATDTPGAKAAGVGPFIALMVTDCYSPADQETFLAGLAAIDDNFLSMSADERLAIVEGLDREQFEAAEAGWPDGPHYFRMLKELTVLGFFTSEVAYAQVLEYVETPGRYEPCRELTPDTRVFADHGSGVS